MKNLITKIKKYRARIGYWLFIALLASALSLMVIMQYASKEKNIMSAALRSQIVVFDVTTGEKVDAATITKSGLKNPPKPAAPAAPDSNKPAQLGFIISGLGLNDADTQKAIALPKEFILSFSPYAEQGLQLSKAAHQAGHNILVDLPVEMRDPAEKQGNLALTTENNQFKNVRNFNAVLSKVDWLAGVLTPPNDIFTKSNNFVPIMQEIAKRKIYLAYVGETDGLDATAKDNDMELMKIDAVIDGAGDLDRQLAALEELGRKNSFAVAVLKNASADSIDKLAKWYATLAPRNIHIVTAAQ